MNGGTTYAYQNGTAITSFANFQTFLNDKTSLTTDPGFANPTEGLQLKNYKNFTIVPNPGVADDHQGISRGKTTTIGAYTVAALDAALTDFGKTDFTASLTGTSDLYVTLMNAGMDTLTSATIFWDDGTLQKQAWKGKLALGEKDSIKIGTFKTVLGSTYRVKAWVTDPNNGKDGYHRNDTIEEEKYICKEVLSGDYTVGTNQDFETMKDALFVLEKCGVKAPVRLLVAAGTYGALEINVQIPGSDTTNTITLMPQANARVTFDGGSGQAGLTLRDAANWIFEGITFGNTSNGLYGVMLEGTNSNILFHNCNINASNTATTSSMAVYFHSASNSNNYPVNVRFNHNNIRGGVANIHMYYMAGKSGNMSAASVAITDNNLTDAYQYGIYSYYYSHYTSISRNSITNRTGSGSFYGMYLYYYNTIDTLDANRIHVNAASGYGIYLYYYANDNRYGGKMGNITNNEIMVSNSSAAYGIYCYYPYYQSWNIFNNSIRVESSSSAAYAAYLYNTSSTYRISFKNNLTVAKGSPAYPVYVSSATYVGPNYMTIDYNDYYGTDLNDTVTNVGYAGSAKTTLADWQTATKQDSGSYHSKPAFTNTSVSLELNDYSTLSCPRLPEAPCDILGTPRGPIASVGCYSLEMFDDFDISAKKIIEPVESEGVRCDGDFAEVSVSIQNRGRVNADFSKNPLTVSLIVTGAANMRKDTVISMGQLGSALTDTIRFGKITTLASGIYHLQIILSDTADHHSEDDTLNMDYNVSHVELPYDVNFTTAPTEFTNVNLSGNSGWEVVQKESGAIAPAFGTGYLKFKGNGHPGNVSDAVFNSVNIYQTTNPKLTLWFAHTDEMVRDFISIQVTNDEGQTYTEIGKLFTSDTGVYWKQYEFDLSKFTNDPCICIALKAYSMGTIDQYIDRIRITADQDAAISLLPIDIDNRVACDDKPVDVKAVITNLSRLNIDMVNDTISLNVTGAVNYSNKVIYNNRLGSFATDTVTLGQIRLDANGAYFFEAFMQPFDDNSLNDTLQDSTLVILQDIALDTVLGLDNQMFKLGGENVNVTAVVSNNGNIPVNRVLLRMSIDGNEVLVDTVHKLLRTGDTIVHAMSEAFTVPFVSKDQPYYFFELKAELGCDADNSNDEVQIIGNVEIPDSIDIQVLEISTTTPATGKTKLAPTIRVANIGNIEADNIIIHVDVLDNDHKVLESVSENISHLAANETKNYAFTMTYKVPNYTGKYTLKAYVETFNGDTIQSNDTLSKEFACYRDSVGIREVTDLDWSLGQNIPNPASEVTAIPFTLPQDGRVRLSVMAANGQVIYRQEVEAVAGDNRLELDASGWASGLYYYSMEFRGQRITRKMNITR